MALYFDIVEGVLEQAHLLPLPLVAPPTASIHRLDQLGAYIVGLNKHKQSVLKLLDISF